jgi:hypothetical protein
MLIFISLSVILTVFFIYQYFAFIRIYYIGQSLHQFRELRHELTLYLAANVKENLSASEATEYYSLLLGIDGVIKNFDLLKVKFLQFSSFKSVSSKILTTSEKVTAHSQSANIQSVYLIKLQECVLTAFKAIPFCRFRFLLFLYRTVAALLVKLGFLKAKKQLNNIEQLAQTEKDILGKSGMPCNH